MAELVRVRCSSCRRNLGRGRAEFVELVQACCPSCHPNAIVGAEELAPLRVGPGQVWLCGLMNKMAGTLNDTQPEEWVVEHDPFD